MKTTNSNATIPTVFPLGDNGVAVKLYSTETTDSVYWSPRGPGGYGGFNSYVLAEKTRWPTGAPQLRLYGRVVSLYSINGAGEIRWPVDAWQVHSALRAEREGRLLPTHEGFETLLAFRHFNLTVDPQEE